MAYFRSYDYRITSLKDVEGHYVPVSDCWLSSYIMLNQHKIFLLLGTMFKTSLSLILPVRISETLKKTGVEGEFLLHDG